MPPIRIEELRQLIDAADDQRVGIVRDHLGRFVVSGLLDSDESTRSVRTALLLGGGSAKGCFQAGALACLAHTNDELYQPNLVCGVSVGSINGILATENAASSDNERIRRLMEIWLSLDSSSDFFVDNPDLVEVNEEIPGWLRSVVGHDLTEIGRILLGGGYSLHSSEVPGFPGTRGMDFGWLDDAFNVFLGTSAVGHVGGILQGPSFAMGSSVITGIIIKGLIDNFEDVLDLRALYSMEPVRRHIIDNMNESLLRWSGVNTDADLATRVQTGDVEFRMVSVEVLSGRITWIDNVGDGHFNALEHESYEDRILNRPRRISSTDAVFTPATTTGSGRPLSFVERIIEGTLGSAANPVAFAPSVFHLTDSPDYEPEEVATLLDGGVKDVVSAQAAEDYLREASRQGHECIAISITTSPRYNKTEFFDEFRSILEDSEHPETYTPLQDYWNLSDRTVRNTLGDRGRGTNFLDILMRAIDLQSGEIDRTDPLDLTDWGFSVDHILISPTFSVNKAGQIDSGLIRIALAYGWMRACDTLFLQSMIEHLSDSTIDFEEEIQPARDAFNSSDLITRLRMNAWRHEMRFVPDREEGSTRGYGGYFMAGAVRLIRETKLRLVDAISMRRIAFESSSLPAFPDSTYMSGEAIDDWIGFEQHSPESFWFNAAMREDSNAARRAAYTFLERNDLWSDSLVELDPGAGGREFVRVPSVPRPTL